MGKSMTCLGKCQKTMNDPFVRKTAKFLPKNGLIISGMAICIQEKMKRPSLVVRISLKLDFPSSAHDQTPHVQNIWHSCA
jgi:hypothetical protein